MAPEYIKQPLWKWLLAGGDAIKWFLIGSFILAAANLAAPHIASFIDEVHQSAPHKDYAFFLIGGLIGAMIGAIWGSKRSGLLTVILSICVASVFYVAEGGLTQEECRRIRDRNGELTQEQFHILRTWATCLKDDLADVCSDLPMSGKRLDELRNRKDYLWRAWRDNC